MKTDISNKKIFCKICNVYTNHTLDTFSRWHLKKEHNISLKEYYNQFFKKENEGACTVCKKETSFQGIKQGYAKTCSYECMRKDPDYMIMRKSCLKKYDRTVAIEKRKITCLEKYGVDTISKNSIIKDKVKTTCLERYGNSTSLQLNLCKTNRIKSHIENKDKINEKRKLWWNTGNNKESVSVNRIAALREKYNVSNTFQIQGIKENIILHNIEKYGVPHYCSSIQHRKHMEEKHNWVPIEDKTEFDLYYREVYQITNRFRKQVYEKWNGMCYYFGIELKTKGKKYDWNHVSVDHKISINHGFINRIDPKIIGDISNLCVCSRLINIVKSSLTETEFIGSTLYLKLKEKINDKKIQ